MIELYELQDSTAVAALFEEKYEKSIGFSIRIFSTPEAAYRWLGRF